MEFMVLENQHKAEDFASFHFQNTLIDYDITISPPPSDKTEIELGVSLEDNKNFGFWYPYVLIGQVHNIFYV